MTELEELIDELVAKAGPTAGCIKKNQDPVKVARLLELGWEEPTTKSIGERLGILEEIVADHEKRLVQCSIQR